MNRSASACSTRPVVLLLAGLLVAAVSCASGGSNRGSGEERTGGGSRLLAKAARVAVAVAVDDEEVGIGTLTSAMRSGGDEDASLASVLTRAAVDVATDGGADDGGNAEIYRDLVVQAAGAGGASEDEIGSKAIERIANRAGGDSGEAALELLGHEQDSAYGDGRHAYRQDAGEGDSGGLARFARAGEGNPSDDVADIDELPVYREDTDREDTEADGLDSSVSAPVGSPFRKKGSKLSRTDSTASVRAIDDLADPDPPFGASSRLDDVPDDARFEAQTHSDPRDASDAESHLLGSAGASDQERRPQVAAVATAVPEATRDLGTDYKRIVNRSQQVLHIETGTLEAGVALPEWKSADWIIEPVSDGIHVRIRNRWRPDVYLHAERGVLEASPIQTAWRSAQWVLEPLAGTPFQLIRNGWQRELYIHAEGGQVAAGPVDRAVASAQWTLESARLPIDVAAPGDVDSGEAVQRPASEPLVCESGADCTMISRCPERAVHVSDPAVEVWLSFAARARFAQCRDSYPDMVPACQQGLCVAVPLP